VCDDDNDEGESLVVGGLVGVAYGMGPEMAEMTPPNMLLLLPVPCVGDDVMCDDDDEEAKEGPLGG